MRLIRTLGMPVVVAALNAAFAWAAGPVSEAAPAAADSPGAYFNARDFGANGDGKSDDAPALQKAIDTAHGQPLFLPPGHYRIKTPLRYHTKGINPGLKLFGAGMGLSVIEPEFADGYAIDIDGSGVRNQFQNDGYLRHFTIDAPRTLKNTGGIVITACWFCVIENVELMHLSGYAIHVPLRKDVSEQQDDYATIFLRIDHNRIVFNTSWAIRLEAQAAAGAVEIVRNQIVENSGGGIYGGGHQMYVGYNAIASNGRAGGGGMEFDQSSANGLVVEHNEFDSNYLYHLRIVSAANGRVSFNRFNSSEVVFKDDSLRPPVQIQLGGVRKVVRNFVFNGNNYRSDTKGNFPLTLYQVLDPAGTAHVRIEDNRLAELTTKLTSYEGFTPIQHAEISEGSR